MEMRVPFIVGLSVGTLAIAVLPPRVMSTRAFQINRRAATVAVVVVAVRSIALIITHAVAD
jgi:hypothetical protein